MTCPIFITNAGIPIQSNLTTTAFPRSFCDGLSRGAEVTHQESLQAQSDEPTLSSSSDLERQASFNRVNPEGRAYGAQRDVCHAFRGAICGGNEGVGGVSGTFCSSTCVQNAQLVSACVINLTASKPTRRNDWPCCRQTMTWVASFAVFSDVLPEQCRLSLCSRVSEWPA